MFRGHVLQEVQFGGEKCFIRRQIQSEMSIETSNVNKNRTRIELDEIEKDLKTLDKTQFTYSLGLKTVKCH